MINAALALNGHVDPAKTEGAGHRRAKGAEQPSDAFNETGDVVALLEKHNWTPVRENGAFRHWRRPGKASGQAASLIDGKIFFLFSQNALPFPWGIGGLHGGVLRLSPRKWFGLQSPSDTDLGNTSLSREKRPGEVPALSLNHELTT